MPGETIREVIIKARIEVEGDDALNKVRENARKWNGELEKAKRNEQAVTNEQKKLTVETNKTRRAQVGLDDALGKVKKAITQASEAYIKGNRSAGKGLDGLIRKEKELLAQIKRRESAVQRARGGSQPQLGAFGRARAGLGAAAGRVNAFRAAGVVAAPIAIVAIGAQALNAWAAATSSSRQLKEDFGIESSILDKISQAEASFFGIDIAGLFGPNGSFSKEDKKLPASNRDQLIAAREKELNLIAQIKQSTEDRYGKEFANQKLIIQNEKQRLKTIEQIAANEEKQRRKSIGGTLAQFTDLDQRAILDSLQRFQKGGAGALGSKERELIGSLGFAQEFFQSQAEKHVDQNVLNAINQIVGEGQRKEVTEAKQQAEAAILKANNVVLDIKKGITVGDIVINAKGFEDAIEKGHKKLAELIVSKFNEALNNAKAEVKNAEVKRKNNINAVP